MLKYGSEQYNTAIKFITTVTNNVILDLYLLYKKAEITKKASDDNRTPIPYYFIDSFAKYECEERNTEKIPSLLTSKEAIDKLIKFYTSVTKGYYKNYSKQNNMEYNTMIKKPVDYNILEQMRDMAKSMF